MKRIIVAVALLVMAVGLSGQEARVIRLGIDSSNKALFRWEKLQEAQRAWDDLQREIAQDYTVVLSTDKDAGNTFIAVMGGEVLASGTICADQVLVMNGESPTKEALRICHEQQAKERAELEKKYPAHSYRRGFEGGFEFSSDFRYIVPKRVEQPQPTTFGTYPNWKVTW